LGYNLSNNLISKSKEKLEKISKLEKPKTKDQLKSFLAFTSYFINSSPKISEKLAPFREYAKKGKRFS
jgi:hypothetical protein